MIYNDIQFSCEKIFNIRFQNIIIHFENSYEISNAAVCSSVISFKKLCISYSTRKSEKFEQK